MEATRLKFHFFIHNYVLLCSGYRNSAIMQNRFLRNISANTVQLAINQVFGLLIFYALSKWFDKNTFGDINWALAVLLTAFAILSFGIDKVIVQKVSAGEDKSTLFSAYVFHVLVTGIFFYALLLLNYFLMPGLFPQQTILLFLGIGKLMIFFSTPYKQMVTGLEKFHTLLYMSIGSNVVRGTGLIILAFLKQLSLANVIIIFIVGDIIEFLLCLLIVKKVSHFPQKITFNRKSHLQLVKTSLPQAGIELFAAIMSRFDWILIGLIITSSKLAEYSFASKVFEVSTLPLLIIQTVLLPLFTRLLNRKNDAGTTAPDIGFLLEWKIIIASFIALALYQAWTPVIDFVTDGKYGAVNIHVIFIFSACMPLMYFNNYLWTINFATGKMKLIFFIMISALIVNVISCLILIPVWKNEGAALALFLSIFVQSVLYLYKTDFSMTIARRLLLFIWPAIAILSCYITNRYIANTFIRVATPVVIYLSVVFVLKQFRQRDWKALHTMYQ